MKAGTLDPLGANIEDGTELYFTLLTNMTETFGAWLGRNELTCPGSGRQQADGRCSLATLVPDSRAVR